jgi:glutamine transport system substrate-binding protein
MRFVAKVFLIVMLTGFAILNSLQAESLIVGCEKDLKPFVFVGNDGRYTGFEIDVWDEVAKILNVTYELRPMAFVDLMPALQAGKIDVALGALSITAAREKIIDFSYPYYDMGLIVMVAKDNPFIHGIGDLDDKVVATKEGTTSDEFAHNIQTKAVKLFPTIEEAYAALKSGQADAVVFDSTVILHHIETQGRNDFKTVGRLYNRQSYGFAFPSGSSLRDRVSIAVLELKEGFRLAVIYSKWFGPFGP